MITKPTVNIIIPAYKSQQTIEKCLRSLSKQTFRDFQVILIDSSPSDACEHIVREGFPWVHYEHVRGRMLPHEARNYGVAISNTKLLIFTDPDIYFPENWISQLIRGYEKYGDVIVGSVQCYGTQWLDQGAHIAKFDMWLSGGQARPIDIAPTLNTALPREIFDCIGGFSGEQMIGDTIFSWDVARAGFQIHFTPDAEVIHHHVTTWLGLLRERFNRGREFGRVRAERHKWGSSRILLHLLFTITPLRWISLLRRTLRCTATAGMVSQAIGTLPVSMSAHAAWLSGESLGFVDSLSGRS